MNLGQWLKQYRQDNKLSQPELAERMSIEQSYLSKLENDKSMPSAKMLDDILQNTETTLAQLIEQLDSSYVYNQLSTLPQVKTYLVDQKLQSQQKSNRRLLMFGILLCLGSFIFYCGMSEVFSSNVRYQYYSGGILQKGEPLETFNRNTWHNHISEDVYHARFNPKTILIDSYQIEAFVDNSDNERRYFSLQNEIKLESSFNRFIKALGVLMFSAGLIGVILLVLNNKVLAVKSHR